MSEPQNTPAGLIAQLEREVKQARAAGDITALLATTSRAMDQLEQAAAHPGATEAERQHAQNTAKKLGYNAAADAWPFWDNPPPARTQTQLQTALAIAHRVAALTAALPENPKQSGNAAWLIGALELALGDLPAAQSHFAAAHTHFIPIPEMKLLAEGYLALAGAPAPPIATTIQTLAAASFPHAKDLAEQLITAQTALATAPTPRSGE